MTEMDLQAAEELEAYLMAHQMGRTAVGLPSLPIKHLRLADQLLLLSNKIQPQAQFLYDLERRLQTDIPPSENRESEAQRLPGPVSDQPGLIEYRSTSRPHPKRPWLLYFASALLIVLFIYFAPVLLARPENPESVVNPALTATSPLAGAAYPSVTPQQELPPLPKLPSLQALIAYAKSVPVASSLFASASTTITPTTFVLPVDIQANLPRVPSEIPVYRLITSPPFTPEQAHQVANRFEIQGELYHTYQWRVGELAFTVAPPADDQPGLVIEAGKRRVLFSPMEAAYLYLDDSGAKTAGADSTSFEDAARVAADFLQSHGLLETPYQVLAPDSPGGPLRFVRLLDGHPLLVPYAQVTLASNQQVSQVFYRRLRLEADAAYPVRNAQQAWDAYQAGGPLGTSAIRTWQQITPQASPIKPQTWQRPFKPGPAANIYGIPTIYLSMDSGPTIVRLGDVIIQGAPPEWAAFKSKVPFVHAWGTLIEMPGGGLLLQLAGWEALPSGSLPEWQGRLAQLNGTWLLTQAVPAGQPAPDLQNNAVGETFILPDAPPDLPFGSWAIVSGRRLPNPSQDYAQIDWLQIQINPDTAGGAGGGGGAESDEPPPQAANPAGELQPTPAGPPDGEHLEGALGILNAWIEQDSQGNSQVKAGLCVPDPQRSPLNCFWSAALEGPGIAGIEKYDSLYVRVWGTFRVVDASIPLQTISVERYEKAYPQEKIQAWLGTYEIASLQGKPALLFHSMDGLTFATAESLDVPDDPTGQSDWERSAARFVAGGQWIIEGVLYPERTLSGYAILRVITLKAAQGVKDLQGYQLTQRPQVIPVEPSESNANQSYTVEAVDLVFYTMPVLPETSEKDPSFIVVQPFWRFAGHSSDGSHFEIWVQAIRDEYLRPAWVGTPAPGNPPSSSQPLPAGLSNGDMVYSDGLLWFIWKNTKSRLWFPATFTEAELDVYRPVVLPVTGLIGASTPYPDRWMIAMVLSTDGKRIQSLYLLDKTNMERYPLELKIPSPGDMGLVPTAYGEQYFPVLNP
jgi:hypothetical protein